MKKNHIILAIILMLFFAEWQIDFAVGKADTALLVITTLLAILISFALAIACLVKKRIEKAVFSAVICTAVIFGTVIGLAVTERQFRDARNYVELLSEEIIEVKKRQGQYPEDLKKLENFDSDGNVPVGIFRKRRLHYVVHRNHQGFTLWFPYKAFLVAKYDGVSKQWKVRD